MSMLSFKSAYGLPTRAEEQRWLINHLWSEEAVGIVGGEPKCGKTFLALDLASRWPPVPRACAAFPSRAPAASFSTPPRIHLHRPATS